MDPQQQDGQQQRAGGESTKRQLLWTGVFAALVFITIVICGYLFGWKWTGLPNRTLWDWLSLLIVPTVLAIGGYLFTERQRTLDREIATKQADTDRDIADQRRQDDALQAYLDHFGKLLLDNDKLLRKSKEDDEVRTLARARTLTVLRRLGGERKGRVLQFLYESRLITKDNVILDLTEADLSEADLSGANLSKADLSEADLSGANLSKADLSEADLSGANLSKAGLSKADLSSTNLNGADLKGADLKGAQLYRTNLSEADLSGANLSETVLEEAKLNGAVLRRALLRNANLYGAVLNGADLRGANLSEVVTLYGANLNQANLSEAQGWTEGQLSETGSLEGTTMPDGQTLRGDKTPNEPTFKAWLKDRERREEDEKNE